MKLQVDDDNQFVQTALVATGLTLWKPPYEYIVPRFRPKTSSFRLPYQCHSSSTNCARELFKRSNGSASLLVCTRKTFLVGVVDFLWVTS